MTTSPRISFDPAKVGLDSGALGKLGREVGIAASNDIDAQLTTLTAYPYLLASAVW